MRVFSSIAALMLISLGVFSPGILMAQATDEVVAAINAHLKRFSEHPSEVMKESPERWNRRNEPVPPEADLRFPLSAVQSGEAIQAKNAFRSQMCMEANGKTKCLTRSEIEGNDRPEDMVDGGEVIRSIETLDSKGLRSAKLSVSPWSDDYWGLYKGMIGARYADPRFPASGDWYENYSYVRHRPAFEMIRTGDPELIDELSPSEKYELLVGDSGAQLTSLMWREGKERYDSVGHVESWIGLCDGWAAAAMMLPRPQKMLTLRAADGKIRLRFYPSDAKALASLLWSRRLPPIRFIGGRCNERYPRTDENGRIISKDCFNTNPGTWHVAVTNQLGIARRSFLIDASYDYEVWNQPALGYRYSYFNPQSLRSVDTLKEARVPKKQFTRDKFGRYRSPKTVAVVGVVMDFTYVFEKTPRHDYWDSGDDDELRTVRYYYDLELDETGNIIGGEWYSNGHPDFLWLPVLGGHAESIAEDEATGNWNGPDTAMPESWRKAALHASQAGQPLGKIIEQIFSWAREN